jgi:hypothetical protein
MAWVVDNDGEVIGEVGDVDGSWVDVGDLDRTVGASTLARRPPGRAAPRSLPGRTRSVNHRLPPHLGQRPSWDQSRHGVSPGPDEYMNPLPMTPELNEGVFTAAFPAITYHGEPQKPYKGERIVSIVGRSGASATGLIPATTAIFVGTDLMQAQQGNIPVEFWPVTAFGVRMHMKDAKPGVIIEMPIILVGGVLAGTDSITILIMILGRLLA